MTNATEEYATVVDRLRSNLRSAGIGITEADLEGMIEKGLLRNAIAFEGLEAGLGSDDLPDLLEAWGPTDGVAGPVKPPYEPGEADAIPLHPRNAETGLMASMGEQVPGVEGTGAALC